MQARKLNLVVKLIEHFDAKIKKLFLAVFVKEAKDVQWLSVFILGIEECLIDLQMNLFKFSFKSLFFVSSPLELPVTLLFLARIH